MDTITLNAEPREAKGRDTNALRADSIVPAVVYGPNSESRSVQVIRNEVIAAFRQAGRSSLVDLVIGGDKPVKVIIQDVQRDPLKDDLTHIDFYEVDLTKEVSATVMREFIGTSAAVKELGGTLVKARDRIEVKGLPDRLVASLEVDISKLNTFDDVFHVKDIVLPEGLSLDMDEERAVALVNPPRTQEEMEKLDEAIEEEVTGADEDEEGEAKEGEEGEAPADGEAKEEGDKPADGESKDK